MNDLKTPMGKYMNDPEYHALVTTMEAWISRCQFTPSEMREAVMLACIRYEQQHTRTLAGRINEPACCPITGKIV